MTVKKAKRFLYLFHRWLGIVLCLWFVLLFASGVIMMYVEYPELTEEERLWQLQSLDAAAVRLSAAEAAQIAGNTGFTSLTLATVLGRPAYQMTDSTDHVTTVFADNGEQLDALRAEDALAAARHSSFADGVAMPRYDALVNIDQWTVSSVLDSHRPLHRVALDDTEGTVVYVSSTTGRIVRDTNRNERFWNWLGSTVHWIYPWQFRQHADLWVDVLTYLSLAGVFSVLSGAIVGWWRLRVRRKYRGDRFTPYTGWQKWHHVLGLTCVLFVSTWAFSGLMSMLPWGIFDNATDVAEPLARYYGGDIDNFNRFPSLQSAWEQNGEPINEVEWRRIGEAYYLVASHSGTGKSAVLSNHATDKTLDTLVAHQLQALLPHARITEQRVITQYDNWYYTHHNRYRPLPALEVRFDDEEQSWFHIDLGTGAVVQRLTATDRWARWLYNGLHSLDFAPLFQHRPLWDVTLILLLMCGFVFTLTAVVIGWRRLRT